ncbi:MAG TPA: hypothetical protein VGD90_06480 [Sphingobacteriaceae bacterium]
MRQLVYQVISRGCLLVYLMGLLLLAFAQNVSDSDLSNRADTNKNFRDQWWLYGVILLVAVIIFLGVVRRRGGRN